MDYNLMDKIHIRDLKIQGILGVYPEERDVHRDIVLNLTLYKDQRQASAEDDFTHAVDYDSLSQDVAAFAERSSFNLVESLAESIARLILEKTPVEAVRVIVDKPGALTIARSVAVDIFRTRS